MIAVPSRRFTKIASVIIAVAFLVSATIFVGLNSSASAQTKTGTITVTTGPDTTVISSSEQSFTDSTTSFATDSGGGVTTVTSGEPTITTMTVASNPTTQSGARCPVMPVHSSEDVPNAPAGPTTILFGSTVSNPSNTTTIPADELVWDTWTTSSTVVVCGALTQFLPGNLTLSPILAFYIDGKLVSQASTPLPAGQPSTHNGTDWNIYMSTPLYINQTVTANSTVTLALFSSTPVTVFIADVGQTYQSPCTSLPTKLPASANSTDYAIGMFGFTDP